ncbi:MAG TPA: hypothetical protein VE153_11020 [Myxococcus sp.]|nr:hypothetical protein [Myxococcus sp.]
MGSLRQFATLAQAGWHPLPRWVRAHGVDSVQGYLISRPRRPPAGTTPFFTD